VDSVRSVCKRRRILLNSAPGGAFTINATAVFDYPTIGSLAEHLANQMPESVSQLGGVESAGAPVPK
jgi:hypothetical protein